MLNVRSISFSGDTQNKKKLSPPPQREKGYGIEHGDTYSSRGGQKDWSNQHDWKEASPPKEQKGFMADKGFKAALQKGFRKAPKK